MSSIGSWYGCKFCSSRHRNFDRASQASQYPTLVMKLTREAPWSQQHASIMGPSNSFFYFGPRTSPGYIVYGNNPLNLPMSHLMRQERDKSSCVPSLVPFSRAINQCPRSRYFTSQSGNNYKWRMSNTRMEVGHVVLPWSSHL